jgi:Fic family protein
MQNQILSLDKINYINSLLTNNDLKTVRRKTEVYSGNTKYIEFSLLNKMLKTLDYLLIFDKDEDIHPLKLSFEIYLRIVTLHPFVDANGRTSRLAADWILLQFGYLPHLFPSTVSSMVAITLGGPLRTKSESYYKFLHAVLNSYRMAEIHLKSQNEKSNEKQYITYS